MASVFTENLVGRVLDQRYMLTELVGVGGSARVYRAEDRRLRRFVAVKVLHASYADDDGFVRRFRQEAEALALLNHENIVSVYDVNDGENASGEPPFIVTEYLGGGTIRSMLDEGYRLTPSQATRLGLEAARGLAFAHARDLVHRDIKPANLLFGDDQRVRIADFGLARALADFSRTEANGIPVGSARYLSPEQARGQAVDGRSDVYSLALVLIELVTGSVPFTADTLAGTTFARTETGIVAPFDMGPLGSLVEDAGTLNPKDRIDAAALVIALEELAKTLPKAEPLSLSGSRLAAKPVLIDRDPTRHAALGSQESTVKVNRREIAGVATVPIPDSVANKKARQTGIFDQALDERPAMAAPGPPATPATPPKSDVTKAARSPWWRRRILALALAIPLLGGAAVFAYQATRTPTHLVPTFAGKTLNETKAEAVALGFVVNSQAAAFSDEVPLGNVISQDPAGGVRLEEKQQIRVVVSKGTAPVEVPDLSGLTIDAATGVLRTLKLGVGGFLSRQPSPTVEAGKVLSWSPTGAVAPGTEIRLTVSSGLPTVAVPKVVGLTEEEALAKLVESNITATVVKAANDSPKGTVYGSEPKAATVIGRGISVKVFVSTGPAFAVVPNVIGLLPVDAIAQLRAAGFRIGNTIGPADEPLKHTRPLRNTRQRRGTVVTLYTTSEGVPEVPGVAATQTSKPPTGEPEATSPA